MSEYFFPYSEDAGITVNLFFIILFVKIYYENLNVLIHFLIINCKLYLAVLYKQKKTIKIE